MWAAIAATVVSSVMSASASKKAGKAQARSAEEAAKIKREQEKINKENALVADAAAEDALRRGEYERASMLRKGKLLRGKQRAAYAGAGVRVDLGSAIDTYDDTASSLAEDVAALRHNAKQEFDKFRVQAKNLRNNASVSAMEAGMLVNQGNSARRAASTAFSTSLLNGAVKAFGIYNR